MSTDDQLAEVRAAAGATLAAPSARVSYTMRANWVWPDRDAPELEYLRRSPVWRVAGLAAGLAWTGIKLVWKWRMGEQTLGNLDAEGIIEPAARRYMVDFGSYAELFIDGDLFGGRSGRPLATLTPWDSPAKSPRVLWILCLLLGVQEVSAGEETELRGAVCRELICRADLGWAADRADIDLQVPALPRFEDLHRLPVSVWIADGRVVRAQYGESLGGTSTTQTIELWDYGVDTTGADWSRLPDLSHA